MIQVEISRITILQSFLITIHTECIITNILNSKLLLLNLKWRIFSLFTIAAFCNDNQSLKLLIIYIFLNILSNIPEYCCLKHCRVWIRILQYFLVYTKNLVVYVLHYGVAKKLKTSLSGTRSWFTSGIVYV